MKRLLALVLLLLLCGGPALAATPAPPSPSASHGHTSRASRVRQPAPKPPVAVVLGSIRPTGYLRAGSTLRVHGRVVNQSESTYQRVAVRLRYSRAPMTSRGELEAYDDGKGLDPQLAGLPRTISASLPPGGQQSWSLAITARQMGLPRFGVYPIAVEVFSATGVVLGHQRTFVTYYPTGSAVQRTKVAWVWPLVDQPHRADDATFVDDKLERLLGPGGRLSDLVAAAKNTTTPISWLIDPGLVDDATRMADTQGYTIKGTKRSVDRPQNVAALDWLRSLHAAVPGDRLIATPYADPDVMALADRHMGKDVRLAAQQGARALADAKLSGATSVVAMPPDGLADQATLSALAASGSRTILLSSTNLPDVQRQTFTPDPLVRKTVSGTDVKLLAYDDTLYKILDKDTTEPSGALVTEQRFLAETAMITGEAPQNPRTIVITPPRRWTPGGAFAKAVLKDTAKMPWLRPVPLSDAENSRASGRTFQAEKDSPGLGKNYLKEVNALKTRINHFSTIFLRPKSEIAQPPTSDFTLGVARTESSAWNGQSAHAKALRHTLEVQFDRAVGKIKILNDSIQMAGKSGRTPITISNGLDHGTVVVTLHAYTINPRLHVDPIDRTLVLEPGHKDQVNLYMSTSANGRASVYLELRAPDSAPIADAHVLHVNANGYGRTALLITGVSLAVLFVGVAIRVIRRRAERAEESVE